jgi:hypothetical protein
VTHYLHDAVIWPRIRYGLKQDTTHKSTQAR